jgi:hypothetical protein
MLVDMTAVAELLRWEAAGGHWRVLSRTDRGVTVALVTCDGGEEMSRLTAPAEEVDGFLAGRVASDEAPVTAPPPA